MKRIKQKNRKKISFLCGVIVIVATLGCFLLNENKSEEIKLPDKPFTAPINPTIPDLFATPAEGNPEDDIPVVILPPDGIIDPENPGDEDEFILPRDKYGLPYPTTTRPESIQALTVQHTSRSGYEYFDGSVFLGDSVTLGLKNYATKQRKTDSFFLGNAQFIAVGSYGVADTLVEVTSQNSIHSLYNGVATQPQDIIADMGASKVFICLGLNDVGIYTQNEYLNNYSVLINRIRKVSPETQIAIISVTPLTLEGERKILYNAKIDEYNNALISFASENGCYFLDIATILKDEEGYLADELSSDNYCHLMPEAYDKWIDYMLTHRIPTKEEEEAMEQAHGGAIHVDKGVPEVEGWEGAAGEPRI